MSDQETRAEGQKPEPSSEARPSTRRDASVSARAASILEQETATVSIALRETAQRFFDLEAAKQQDPSEVFERFRSSAHEAIDMMVNLANVAAGVLNDVAKGSIKAESADRKEGTGGAGPIG
jgi:hypothetical protein